MNPLLNERIARFESPFRRLDALLAGIAPNPQWAPIVMSVGEPQDAPPSWLADTVAAHARDWNRYPQAIGTPEFRNAARAYLERRYPATRNRIDPECGSERHRHAASMMPRRSGSPSGNFCTSVNSRDFGGPQDPRPPQIPRSVT